MWKKSIRTVASAVVFLGTLGLGMVMVQAQAGAKPKGGCTPVDVAGHYGFIGNGQILDTNLLGLPAGPFATSGTMEAKADGTWSAIQSASFNGSVSVEFPAGGTWSVTPDCRFTIVDATEEDFGKGAVVNNANEILFMDGGQGIAATFRLVRIETK